MNQDAGELYRGARLERAVEWAARPRNFDDFNDLERAFLAASQELAQRELEELQAVQRREIEAAQALEQAERQRAQEQSQAANRLRRYAIFLGAALLLVLILAGVGSLFSDRNATPAR